MHSMNSPGRLFGIALLALAAAAACSQNGGPAAAPSPLPGGGSDTGTERPVADGQLRVTEVEVLVALSYPARVTARVAGVLPDACTNIRAVSQSREGRAVTVTITTTRTGQLCAEVLRPVTRDVPLEGAFESGEYLLRVNGLERRFVI